MISHITFDDVVTTRENLFRELSCSFEAKAEVLIVISSSWEDYDDNKTRRMPSPLGRVALRNRPFALQA